MMVRLRLLRHRRAKSGSRSKASWPGKSGVRWRNGLAGGPENSVQQQPTKGRVREIIRMTQRRVEHARLFVAIGMSPGHRLGGLIRDGTDEHWLGRALERANLVKRAVAGQLGEIHSGQQGIRLFP